MATIELGNSVRIGLFAARPDYAAVEVGQEVNKAIYVATDTGQMFAWDGTTWHDVATTAGVDGLMAVLAGIVGDGTNTTVEIDVDGASLSWNSSLDVRPTNTPLEAIDARTLEFDPVFPLTDDGNNRVNVGPPFPAGGSDGDVLTLVSGSPAWVTPA